MRAPELLLPSSRAVVRQHGRALRRRRIVVTATAVCGTALLAGTLRTSPGSPWFSVLGFLAAGAWIGGGLASGPVPWDPERPLPRPLLTAAAAGVGVLAFGGFLGADLVVRHLPWISGELSSILGEAATGPTLLVLAVTLVNGVAEEIFFRAALLAALPARWAPVIATGVYVAVTAATGNFALVVAAVVMGTIFMLERLSTRGILASTVTHLTWSVLVFFLLPR